MPGMREKILKAAMELFAARGYAGTSTRAICEAAGISKPVLYYYFRDKQHLYQELMIDSFAYYRRILLRASKARGGLRARLTRMLADCFRAAREERARVEFLLRMILVPEQRLPEFDYLREFEEQRAIIARMLREGGGRLRGDPHRLAAVVMGVEFFTILEHFHTGRAVLTRRNAAALVGVLLDGCLEG